VSAIQSTRNLRLPEVLKRLGFSKATWYRLIATGHAPAPVKIGQRISVWPSHVIDEYLRQQGASK